MVFGSQLDLVGMREPHPRHDELARICERGGDGAGISGNPSGRLCVNERPDTGRGIVRGRL